ncbi:hypothetical protein AWENTII_011983 [Aspergillus wentii]
MDSFHHNIGLILSHKRAIDLWYRRDVFSATNFIVAASVRWTQRPVLTICVLKWECKLHHASRIGLWFSEPEESRNGSVAVECQVFCAFMLDISLVDRRHLQGGWLRHEAVFISRC